MTDAIINILKTALAEDLGPEGDITSAAIFDASDRGEALIRCKQPGVLSGVTLVAPLFELVDTYLADPSMISFMSDAERPRAPPAPADVHTKAEIFCADGDLMEAGAVICRIEGPVRSILAGERTALNLLQRLSGVATAARNMVKVLEGSGTRLLDTRKTTPGLRQLEKAAVRHGGGASHRCGLYDMILIKDTHIRLAGGVRPALKKAFAWRGGNAEPLIEIEVQSVAEFLEALALGPDRIMLDNMSPDEIEQCVEGRGANASKKGIALEASGNVSLSTLPAIAAAGVDFVSSGALTHSAAALDIHLVMV